MGVELRVRERTEGGIERPPLLEFVWGEDSHVELLGGGRGQAGIVVSLAVAAQVKTLVAEFQRGFSKHRRGGRACEVCGAHCDDRSPTCKGCSPRRRGHTDEAAKAD